MIHSFLLIGQSNMAGRGFRNEAPEIKNPNIKILRNGRWVEMFFPVNPDRAFSGRCLGESFADAYAKERGVQVGLIPCADGGTSIDQWKKGGVLYDNAVFQAKLAARSSALKGILWHQGEADCGEELYPLYSGKLSEIITCLRQDIGADNIPFICGGLGGFLADCSLSDTLKNYHHINTALKKCADEDKTVGFASAEGLTANPDNLHFNAKSLMEFGERYFEEFKRVEANREPITEKIITPVQNLTDMERL